MLVTITRVINWVESYLHSLPVFAYQIIYLIAPYIKKEKPTSHYSFIVMQY